ncbi:hypothetical protein AUK40_03120 [Candidatus Wirthbacteria bacterium CG2_30_54_11]|uniref:Electron transfer flavoprotein alpha/beta-subunit N-terminal domain-containing protein n=1 Tax=Candidatus Wirthbacteria bacterium CG2_30_54_11 TaxID=1817892 RepID=A0A1J5IL91_9BACT|nr:MAG: hypothetical protein AUK40_03120 [Candidatus Wirthbacteria bacterium CG2_30_54_11]
MERTGGVWAEVSLELLAKAKELGHSSGAQVVALALGHSIGEQAKALLNAGADRVVVCDDKALRLYNPLTYASVVCRMISDLKPSIVLMGATILGRDLSPRVAARLGTGLSADCTDLHLNADGILGGIKPTYGGSILAEIVCPVKRPQMMTVRPHVFPRLPGASFGVTEKGTVEPFALIDTDIDHSLVIGEEIAEAQVCTSLSTANVVVCGGRGMGDRETFGLCEKLALALGGMAAGTRPAVEEGWITRDRQIGLSGETIAPRLLICCGVSGAASFTTGMLNAGTVVAINIDARAPMMAQADYAIVGDAREVMPLIIRQTA